MLKYSVLKLMLMMLALLCEASKQCVSILKRSYVVYPQEALTPPSPEELREMARELARKNNIR